MTTRNEAVVSAAKEQLVETSNEISEVFTKINGLVEKHNSLVRDKNAIADLLNKIVNTIDDDDKWIEQDYPIKTQNIYYS